MSTTRSDDTEFADAIHLRKLSAEEFDRVSQRLLAVARRFGADGEDLLQEAFAKVWDPEDPGLHIGQLIKAVTNLGIDRYRNRRRRREVPLDGGASLPAHEKSPVDGVLAIETGLAVQSAVSRLSSRGQEILRLTFHEGLNCSEAAEVLGINHAAARRRRHVALGHLRSSPEFQAIFSDIFGGGENHV